MEYYRVAYSSDSLQHHGIKGQKWGRRRYQYEDMSLTPEGREHYGVGEPRNKDSSSNESRGSEKTHKGLSDSQKRALAIAAISVAAVGIGVVAVKNKDSIEAGIKAVSKLSDKKVSNITNFDKFEIPKVETPKNTINFTQVHKVETPKPKSSGINLTFDGPDGGFDMDSLLNSFGKLQSVNSYKDTSGIDDLTSKMLNKTFENLSMSDLQKLDLY